MGTAADAAVGDFSVVPDITPLFEIPFVVDNDDDLMSRMPMTPQPFRRVAV